MKAGFFPVAPEARGAKVGAAERARRATWCVLFGGGRGREQESERIEDRRG